MINKRQSIEKIFLEKITTRYLLYIGLHVKPRLTRTIPEIREQSRTNTSCKVYARTLVEGQWLENNPFLRR